MLKEQAGTPVELPQPANGKYLEHQNCEIVREVFQTLDQSCLDEFTHSFIDSLCNDLNGMIHELDCLPEAEFKELIEVIHRLGEARDELRLALFLFDLEEIDPLYRLLMRNRAVLRGQKILQRVLWVWPLYNSSHG